ncbi:hypothetical protein WJX72_004039 [[Myrmecia] bisecta]|uniref:SET domain-containing protein n=1 Tax=[Myrmecia] bisecta TaxID=41462 RepID=A0AAW1R5Q8_9CHLO
MARWYVGLLQLHAALNTLALRAIAPGCTLEEVQALLQREQCNGYGICAEPGPQRAIRGFALYEHASLVNHECLPNIARFDDYDKEGDFNTTLTFHAMQDIPAGAEVTQSYFPLNLSLPERQQACNEIYGFACTCMRCQVEGSWSSDESEVLDGEEEGEAGAHAEQSHQASSADASDCDLPLLNADEGITDAYLQLFCLKYICPQPDCCGTLAPTTTTSSDMTCNRCGSKRSEAEFLAEVEDFYGNNGGDSRQAPMVDDIA